MKQIICHGDSLTEGVDIETAYRWPSLLQNSLGLEVVNTGIGGDTTAGLLSRFPTDVVPHKPIAVILMGGTNDFWWGLPVNSVMANIYTMAYQAQHHGIAPIFGTPLPFDGEAVEKQPFRPPESGYNALQAKIHGFVSALKTAAKDSEIPVMDFQRIFIDDQGQVRSRYFLEDGLHVNREGHRRMAVLAAATLKELLLFA